MRNIYWYLLFIPILFVFGNCSRSSFTAEEKKIVEEGMKSRGNPDTVPIEVDRIPIPVDGIKSLALRIKYPDEAKAKEIEGRVILQFLVTVEGTVEDIKVLQGIGYGCDEEAKRVLLKTKFHPGIHNGKVVPVITSVPISFEL